MDAVTELLEAMRTYETIRLLAQNTNDKDTDKPYPSDEQRDLWRAEQTVTSAFREAVRESIR